MSEEWEPLSVREARAGRIIAPRHNMDLAAYQALQPAEKEALARKWTQEILAEYEQQKRRWEGNAPVEERITTAVELARSYAGIASAQHRAWVIDQMVRHLLGSEYGAWLAAENAARTKAFTSLWDHGVAP